MGNAKLPQPQKDSQPQNAPQQVQGAAMRMAEFEGMVRDRDIDLLRASKASKASKALEMTQVEKDRRTSLRDQQVAELRARVQADRESAKRDREGLQRVLARLKKQVCLITGGLNAAYANFTTAVTERDCANQLLADCRV
eukprot:8575613-Lingulodinium_polyedra.AAC.1